MKKAATNKDWQWRLSTTYKGRCSSQVRGGAQCILPEQLTSLPIQATALVEGNHHCTMPAQILEPQHEALQSPTEQIESNRFYSGEHWETFTAQARHAVTWREQTRILIRHLLSHRERLSSYDCCPRDSWLVGWALSQSQPPLRQFVVWSLHYSQVPEDDVTIEMFANHLEVWADVFLSEEALYYALANPDRPFFITQVSGGAPWMAHFLDSQAMHRAWAKATWNRHWLKYHTVRSGPNMDVMDWEYC